MKRQILISLILLYPTLRINSQSFFVPNGSSGIGASSNGNIGINIQTPNEKLDIYKGNLSLYNDNTNANINLTEIKLGFNSAKNAKIIAYQGENNDHQMIKFKTYYGGEVDAMTIYSNGWVGLGTSLPDDKLEIYKGNLSLYNDNANANINLTEIKLGFNSAKNAKIIAYQGENNDHQMIKFKTYYGGEVDAMTIYSNGWVGLGTSTPSCKLDVIGTIRAHKIKINAQTTADFVFAPGYQLPTLNEVETYINTHKHLPGIASAGTMEKEGVEIGDLQISLLQKIEELMLYSIEQNKKIKKLEEQEKQNTFLQQELADQKAQYQQLLTEVKELKSLIKK
jgi:hypothetical protein